ncbi:MAG: winged helix-turn-helix domain-containing protein [Acidimicrobiia bacterium]
MNRTISTDLPLGAGADSDLEFIQAGELHVFPEEFAVFLKGQRIEMPFKEFRLIVLLAQNYGRVVTRKRIVDEVWDGDAPGRTVDVHMARLRSRLPEGAIQTIVKVGYRLVAR